jgi:molybdenum cofactor cytidylyltransferase
MIGALILSGGDSVRMGTPKAFLKIGNATFLEKIISAYQMAGVTKLIVVLNKKLLSEKNAGWVPSENKNIKVISNPAPELGRFYSIKLGMQKLSSQRIRHCFIQNVDNPFIPVQYLKKMMDNGNPGGYALPVYEKKGGHPVLISRKVMDYIDRLTFRDRNLHAILEKFSRKEVPVNSAEILANINTPADYKTAMRAFGIPG